MIRRMIGLAAILTLIFAIPVAVPAADTVTSLEASVTKALQTDNGNELNKAITRLKQLDPANPLVAHGLVRLAGKGNDALIYDALSALNLAITAHPDDMQLKRARALFVISAPWQRLALADLGDVIAAEDPGGVALKAFVDAAAGNDRTDLGEARISDLLSRKRPADPGLLRARADLRYIRGNFDGALKDLEDAIASSTAILDDHLLRYRIHTKRGEDSSALADVDAMRLELPEDTGLMRMRAALLIRLGRSNEADQMLIEANKGN